MQQCDLEALKDFILANNNYLQNGYANAYKDEQSKAILVRQHNDLKQLLPNDTLGNYCYLRNEATLTHEALPLERLADSGAQRLSFLDTMTVQLVAVVNDADAYLLVQNLRNTAMLYSAMNVQPTVSILNREQVLQEELSRLPANDLAAALQRLKDETIVRVTLRVSKPFTPSHCITNPCKPLS